MTPDKTAGDGTRKAHLRSNMRGLSKRLTAMFEETLALSDPLMKGEVREDRVISALRPFIGSRYEMAKGVVMNAAGEESRPQDIIIWDTSVFPSFLGSDANKAVPVESVVGVIQVKSYATPSNMRDALDNVATAKRLLTSEKRYGHPISGNAKAGQWATGAVFFGGVLFLHCKGDGKSTAEEFSRHSVTLPVRERVDAACALDRFTVMWANPSKGPQSPVGDCIHRRGLLGEHRGRVERGRCDERPDRDARRRCGDRCQRRPDLPRTSRADW